jgi:hypothetical protein
LLSQIVATVLLLSIPLQSSPPERQVDHNAVTSLHDPAVKIRLPNSAVYVGADRWVLYDIADCELHSFVEGDSSKNVQRLYWIQFEQYIPTRPEVHHTYDSPRHTTLGGMDFYVDTWVRAKTEPSQPGSDREHIVALIQAKGFQMPESMMYVRLVHLLDEQKRKELMIIYGEVLPGNFTAPDLKPDGAKHDQWPALEKGLLERAKKNVVVEPLRQGAGTTQ